MITRRTLLAGLGAALATPAQAGDHPSVVYMRQVAKDLLAAHRQGTVSAFLRAVQRHADVPTIAQFALGQYSGKLQPGQRARYERGVATYLARYFALQSRDYTVAKYDIGEATVDRNQDVIVQSKVYLMTGQTYTVNWKLDWKGGRYKVRDASVLGFWLTEYVTLPESDVKGALWLSCGNKAHDIAFVEHPDEGRFHHAAFLMESWEKVLRAAQIMAKYDVPIDIGPTQHGITRGGTIYAWDPSGNRVETFQGGEAPYPDWGPIAWNWEGLGAGGGLDVSKRILHDTFLTVVT